MPYSKMSEVPENLKELDGAKLSLAQANQIAAHADGLEGKEGIKAPYAIAISTFKKGHKINEEGKWVAKKPVAKKKDDSYDDELNALRNQFEKEFGGEAVESMTPSTWVHKVFPGYLIAQVDRAKYYKVPFSKSEEGMVFAPRSEWTEVEQVWVGIAPPEKVLSEGAWKDLDEQLGSKAKWFSLRALGEVIKSLTTATFKAETGVTSVWKDADGEMWYLGVISTTEKDEEEETVAGSGMDFSIALSKKYGFHSKVYLEHQVPKTCIGTSVFEMRIGKYWLELGKFRKGYWLAEAAFNRLQRRREEGEESKLSIGFLTSQVQKKEGRYTRLLKYDTSLVSNPANVNTVILVGGKTQMSETLKKLMEHLDVGEDEQPIVAKMLAELMAESKSTVIVSKDAKGDLRKELLDSLEGDQKALATKLLALYEKPPAKEPPKKEPEKKPPPEEKKKGGEEETPDAELKAVQDAVAELTKQVVDLQGLDDRLKALEADGAMTEVISALIKKLPSEGQKTSQIEGLDQAAVKTLMEQLTKAAGGGGPESAHPLSGFFGAPQTRELGGS